MRAITIWQPWASLLACGEKRYETRSWAIHYRGPVAIHAAARPVDTGTISSAAHYPMARALMRYSRQFAHTPGYNITLNALPRGAVIATAELVGCHGIVEHVQIEGFVETATMLKPAGREFVHEKELLYGDWTPGRYAWEFANMQLLEEPIPAKGGQRIWTWNP